MELTPSPARTVQSPFAQVSPQLYARLIGLLVMLLGVAGWWYNWHLLSTEGYFYIKLCLFGPLALGGGLLFMVRPEWTGPWRPDSTRGHKAALISLVAFMAVASGIDMYLLKTHQSPRAVVTSPRRLAVPSPPRAMPSFTPVSLTPSLVFQGQTYRLGSFNQRHNATWEFVTPGETVNDWTTLLTIVDRPDARTREELDRLAEGLMTAYESNGARVLAAKTMQDDSGTPYNYLVVAFEEPAKQRFELNFVKVGLGAANAVVAIHGARISDPQDYRSKAKEFLDKKSREIGAALAKMVMPDVAKLPRRTF